MDVAANMKSVIFYLNSIYDFPENTEGALVFTGVIIALMELYDFNEQDFIRLWEGEIEIEHPVNRLAKA